MRREPGDPYKLTEAEIEKFATNFDHHDDRYGGDPYPVFDRMRERGPLTWSDNYGGYWIVTGYEESFWIWKSHELFGNSPSVSLPGGLGTAEPIKPLEVDPPLHARYRAPLQPHFGPRKVAEMEGAIRRECDALIDQFIDRKSCEFLKELAEPLPTKTFLTLFGIPLDEAPAFIGWKNQILHAGHKDPTGKILAEAGGAVRDRFRALLVERKKQRRGDYLSLLVDARPDGGPLSDDEILDVAQLYFLAGLDTVQGALGFQFWHLAKNPAHRDRLVAEPGLIPQAVEEFLRWEGMIHTRRTARQDVEVAGVTIKQGCPIILPNRAANHDPKQFPDPEKVDFDRPPGRHMAFGVGAHACQGQHLARLELRIVHEQMHKRIPNYRLREGAFIKTLPGNATGLDALPLVWD